MDCLFCKIVAGEIPAHKVYEDDDVLAFLDIGPVSEGHTLVIPKAHAENLSQGSLDDAQRLMAVIHGIVPAILHGVGASGYNLGMNHGIAAGQDVLHTHLHVMPRKAGEPRNFVKMHPTPEELTATKEHILTAIASMKA